MDQGQGSQATGTRDETYNLVSVVYHALQGAENCQTYMQDVSGKQDLRQFFERACDMQRQLADEGKRLLHDQLMQGGSDDSGSAFSQFGSSGGSATGGSQTVSSGNDQFGSGGGENRGSRDMNSPRMGSTAGSARDVGNDPQSEQFGQSPSGQGQRNTEMNTGGGGTSSF